MSDDDQDLIKARILKVFEVYPRLSPSMLQVGIGPALPPQMWRPVLEKLISDGTILRTIHAVETASGRQRSATVLSMATAAEAVTAE